MANTQESDLREQVAELQDELARLRARAAFDGDKLERFRALLLQARSALEQTRPPLAQQAEKTSGAPLRRFPASLARCTWFRQRLIDSKPWRRFLAKRSRVLGKDSKTVAQSNLEASVLAQARLHVQDIGDVYLDFVSEPDVGGEVTNWRLAGVRSGQADRDAALAAVLTAVAQHRSCKMVRG